MRRSFLRATGVTPQAYRDRFSASRDSAGHELTLD
jgi:hypothetical protein